MSYRMIVHLEAHQDDTVERYFNDPDSFGPGDIKGYLLQWEYGEGEEYLLPPWGQMDDVSEFTDSGDTYYLVSNDQLEYVSLVALDVD